MSFKYKSSIQRTETWREAENTQIQKRKQHEQGGLAFTTRQIHSYDLSVCLQAVYLHFIPTWRRETSGEDQGSSAALLVVALERFPNWFAVTNWWGRDTLIRHFLKSWGHCSTNSNKIAQHQCYFILFLFWIKIQNATYKHHWRLLSLTRHQFFFKVFYKTNAQE